MRANIFLLFILFFSLTGKSLAQGPELEYFITGNGNLYLPINNPEKGTYPILWYDQDTDPKLLIGGMGVGAAVWKEVHPRLSLKGQANLSKQASWGEPIGAGDGGGNSLGAFLGGSADYTVGVGAMGHFFLTEKLSVGTGLGGQLLLLSLSRVPDNFPDAKRSFVVNRYYRPFIPTIPLEVSIKTPRKVFSVRYEQGLINRIKGDLGKSKRENFGLLFFEMGFKIKG
jgi:hypothetical protein